MSTREHRRRAKKQAADDYTAIDRLLGGKGRRTESPTRQTGELVSDKFNERGFGFIKPDDGGKDLFVGVAQLRFAGLDKLEEGTRVSFETRINLKNNKPQAINIAVIGA
jgi:cold shock protein